MLDPSQARAARGKSAPDANGISDSSIVDLVAGGSRRGRLYRSRRSRDDSNFERAEGFDLLDVAYLNHFIKSSTSAWIS